MLAWQHPDGGSCSLEKLLLLAVLFRAENTNSMYAAPGLFQFCHHIVGVVSAAKTQHIRNMYLEVCFRIGAHHYNASQKRVKTGL